MTATHVPVLAGELIELLDPQPGEIAVDCTFGGGGHARLVAERLGPTGTLIAIDRDPPAEERFAELAAEVAVPHALHPRRLRRRRSSSCATRASRADLVYLDLGMSSMQVDTRERGFSYAYDAPLDMRMDPDAGADRRRDRQHVGRAPARARCCASTARSATPARSPARSSAPRAPRRSTRRSSSSRSITAAIPAPARFAGGHPAKRTFQAIRIAVNDELGQLDAALPLAWELLRAGRPFAAISFHSLEDRRVKRFLADRARGLHLPARPARSASAAARPRPSCSPAARSRRRPARSPPTRASKSARLRAARKLEVTDA